jgi:hypothetical protein
MFRDALRGWEELDVPWDQALATIDMAMTVGPDEPAVAAAAATARTILEGLGANAMLARLEAAMFPGSKPRARIPEQAQAQAREGASV